MFSPFPWYLVPLTYRTTNCLKFLEVALYRLLLRILQEIHKKFSFSPSGLHCLEADRKHKTKHYPGAVPSHWPKSEKLVFLTIKQIAYSYYVKNTITVHVYLYLIMATYFGLSLDHLQTYLHKYVIFSVRSVYGGTPCYLQGVREKH